MAFSWFEVAEEGSSHGSEFRGVAPSFLSPWEGFLEEGADLNVWRGEEGTVGKGTRTSRRHGGTQVWDKYSGLRAKAAY